jgi:hypothetical protein
MQIIGAIILAYILFHPSVIVWIGQVTGITHVLYAHHYLTGSYFSDPAKVILFIVGVPIIFGLIFVVLAIIWFLISGLFWAPAFKHFDYDKWHEENQKKAASSQRK